MNNNPHNSMGEYERQWLQIFNELCHDVFYVNEKGAQLLKHLENRYFRCPVAYPDKEIGWTFINEGRNELIRSFTAGIQTFIAQAEVKMKQSTARPIPRRARVKPIP